MKTLAILFTLFYFLNALAVAPYGIKGQNQSVTYPNVYQYPNYSVTGLGGINALIETGNKNILENPSFEAPFFGSAPPSWTSLGMTFNTSALPLSGQKAVRVSMSSSVMAFAQDSGVSQAAFAGGIQCLAMVYVKTTVSGIFVSSRQNSVTSTTNRVAVNNDGKYGLYKVPFICGSGSNGISIHSNGVTVTGDVDVDDAFVGVTDIAQISSAIGPWTTYTPTVSSLTNSTATGRWRQVGNNMEVNFKIVMTGTPAATSVGVSVGLPSGYTIDTLNGVIDTNLGALGFGHLFDSSTNAHFTLQGLLGGASVLLTFQSSLIAQVNAINTTAPVILAINDTIDGTFTVPITQFSGATSVYTSNNADTDWAACSFSTLAWQGLGTVTNTLMCKRQGSDLLMMGAFTSGTATTSLMQIPLPTWNNSSLTIKALSYSGANTVGTGYLGTPFSNTYKEGNIIAGSGLNYLSIGGIFDTSTQNPLAPMAGNAFIGNSTVLTLFARIPILGWENSNIIIGQFNGLQTCTDTLACTDTFSAYISAAGIVSNENIDWLTGNCSLSATSQFDCTVKTGLTTVGMNCSATTSPSNAYGQNVHIAQSVPTSLITVTANNGTSTRYGHYVICQKQGADYIGKTAMAVASDQNVRSIGSTNVDIQSVYFGSGANCTAACTTGTCTICNQVGSKITSVTWASTGNYNFNGIDGTKYNCSGSSINPGVDYRLAFHDRPASTSSLARIVTATTTTVNAGLVSVTCIGIP